MWSGVEQIGDSAKIGRGAARVTKNPRDLLIAERAARLIAESGWFRDGYSFQTGAGAISIACTNFLADLTAEKGIGRPSRWAAPPRPSWRCSNAAWCAPSSAASASTPWPPMP